MLANLIWKSEDFIFINESQPSKGRYEFFPKQVFKLGIINSFKFTQSPKEYDISFIF